MDNPLDFTYGDRLRKVRKALHLSQSAFAELIGESPGNLATWEAGGHPRKMIDTTHAIERSVGVPGLAAWLLGVGPPPDFSPAVTCRSFDATQSLVVPMTEPHPLVGVGAVGSN